MNPFSGTFLNNCSFVLLWVASFKRLRCKASPSKSRKASKNQEEILTCALQNDCSKIAKILGKSLCQSPVLETLSCNFIKTGLQRWHFPRKFVTYFDIGKGVHLFNKTNYCCFGRATVDLFFYFILFIYSLFKIDKNKNRYNRVYY